MSGRLLPAQQATPTESRTANAGDEFDRAIAIVNGDLVLDSDVDKELRFQGLNVDLTANADPTEKAPVYNRNEAIERLINRKLIDQQIRLQDEPDMEDADVEKRIESLRQSIPACAKHQCDSDAEWSKYLQTKGFTVASFTEYWKERLEVLSFIEERFRSGIRVDPVAVKNYYEKTLLPRYAAAHVQAPPLEKVTDRIQTVLTEEQVSKLLNSWLQTLRAQGGVVILHPGQAVP